MGKKYVWIIALNILKIDLLKILISHWPSSRTPLFIIIINTSYILCFLLFKWVNKTIQIFKLELFTFQRRIIFSKIDH